MSKKKKTAAKIKKQRDRERERLLNMDEAKLINEGDNLFSAGNIRDSIKFYQTALKQTKSNQTNEQIKAKLFTAYATRAKEFKDKKMFSEAKTLEKQAQESLPNPSSLDSSGMSLLFQICELEQAFEYYNIFYNANGACAKLERALAEILIEHHCWQSVQNLHNDSALKKDAPSVEPALLLMDKGEWDLALEQMEKLSRSSPFAHIRLFCKAMNAFYKDNDIEMLKAISMIPDDSMLIKITDALRDSVDKQSDNIHPALQGDPSINRCLWHGSFDIHEKLETIITLRKKENYNDHLKNTILEFASLLMPSHIDSTVCFILETIWAANADNAHQFFKMAENLIKKKAHILKLKTGVVFMDDPFVSALEYFKHLDQEFSSKEEQKIAKAMIIHYITTIIVKTRSYSLFSREKKSTLTQLGIKSNFKIAVFERIVVLEMILFALEIDPENRDLYDLAMQIPTMQKEANQLKEKILVSKSAAFPDDPEPLLKLAWLYHKKNAYRKAEQTLHKAMKLAPHDSRVMDQHVISLLISADKSVGKKKFHLTHQDIEKAKQLDSKHCATLIAEKSIFYKIAETGQIDEAEIQAEFDKFSLTDQLKCHAMLLLDLYEKLGYKKSSKLKQGRTKAVLREKQGHDTKNPLQTAQSMLKKSLSRLEELTSWDVFNLLAPFPEEWEHLFKSRNLVQCFAENCAADIFSCDSNVDIFSRLEDRDLLNLIERIDQVKVYSIFVAELEKRVSKLEKELYRNKKMISSSDKKKKNSAKNRGKESVKPEEVPDKPEEKMIKELETHRKLLQLYKITLKSIISHYVYNEYADLVRNLDPETKIILKDAAKKLSKKTCSPLQEALEQFDFEILAHAMYDRGRLPFDFFNFFDDDDDDYDDDYDDDDYDLASFFDDEDDETAENPFFDFGNKNNPNPFSEFGLPKGMDLKSISPEFIKMFSGVLRMMLKSPEGREIEKRLDIIINDFEAMIDSHGLRGKSDGELKKAKKEFMRDHELVFKCTLINECYKKEAIAKFSREAKIVFIK
ncbi:MAG: hypothetical protein HQK62_07265 [Desulfamplus sp.]|nr:hypothetical protein [Desulfamplus sp.]